MSSPDTITPPPQREGAGRLVLIGMVLGVVLTPLVTYFALDLLGSFGPSCTASGGGEDRIACSMRHLIMTGMSIPAGALLGFFVAYWIACRRFNAGG
jgi:hypothetical protein